MFTLEFICKMYLNIDISFMNKKVNEAYFECDKHLCIFSCESVNQMTMNKVFHHVLIYFI